MPKTRKNNSFPPSSTPSWLEARFRESDSQTARILARKLRRAGARHLWQQGSQVWAIWPDTPEAHLAATGLADTCLGRAPLLRRFRAADPRDAWRDPQPQPVGPSLGLAPAWMGLPASRQVMVLEAGTAFGDGSHPSTWLNLEMLCHLLAGEEKTPAPGSWAADVGSGSGVLALALALAGGLKVLALDPDPAARRATARNLALNPLAGSLVHFVQATHVALAGAFGLMTANLPWPILRAAGPTMAACLLPGGCVVVSGFREEAKAEVTEFFAGLGLAEQGERRHGGWIALALSKA